MYILKGNTEIEHNIEMLTVEMVKRCVAAGCSNTHSDGVSLFHFPRDPSLRLQWTRQVQQTRDGWKGPSDYSVLCSKHFTSDCYEGDSAIAAKFGIEKRRRLKPNAVPTVFLIHTGGECSSRKRAGQEVSVPVEKERMVYDLGYIYRY